MKERERQRERRPKEHDNLLCDFFAYFASANGMECCARRLPNSNGAVKTSNTVCVRVCVSVCVQGTFEIYERQKLFIIQVHVRTL